MQQNVQLPVYCGEAVEVPLVQVNDGALKRTETSVCSATAAQVAGLVTGRLTCVRLQLAPVKPWSAAPAQFAWAVQALHAEQLSVALS